MSSGLLLRSLIRFTETRTGKVTTYYPNGLLETMTAPPDRVTTYTYDEANRPISVQNPANETTQSTYYPDGQLKESIKANLKGTGEFKGDGRI